MMACGIKQMVQAVAFSVFVLSVGGLLVLGFLEFWFGYRPGFMDACLIQDCHAHAPPGGGLHVIAGGLLMPLAFVLGVVGFVTAWYKQRQADQEPNPGGDRGY